MTTKVIACSLWGNDIGYSSALADNYAIWRRGNFDRELWVYHDTSITLALRRKYPKIRWIEMPESLACSRMGAFWRFLAIDEADNIWCRDIDSILFEERNTFMDKQWQQSGKRLAIFRDHIFLANLPILRGTIRGGCFNLKGCTNGLMLQWINDYAEQYWTHLLGSDEFFLGRHLFPIFKDDCAIFTRSQKWMDLYAGPDVGGVIGAQIQHGHDGFHCRVAWDDLGYISNDTLSGDYRYLFKTRLLKFYKWLALNLKRSYGLLFYGIDYELWGRAHPWHRSFVDRIRSYHQSFFQKIMRRLLLKGTRQDFDKKYASFVGSKTAHLSIVVCLCPAIETMPYIHAVVCSIMRQVLPPQKIVLYLKRNIALNKELEALQEWGVVIKRVSDGTHLRDAICLTQKDYPEWLCVSAGDNILYHRCWLDDLYCSWWRDLNPVCAHYAQLLQTNKICTFGKRSYFFKEINPDTLNAEIKLCELSPSLSRGVMFAPNFAIKPVWRDYDIYNDCIDDDAWLKLALDAMGVRCTLLATIRCAVAYLSDDLNNLRQGNIRDNRRVFSDLASSFYLNMN